MRSTALVTRAFRVSWRGAFFIGVVACRSQQCDCYDVAPSAGYFVDLASDPAYDEDSGTLVPAPDIRCTATLTGPANVIAYDIGPGTTCTKHGGDAPVPASGPDAGPDNGCDFAYWTEDASPTRNASVSFRLNEKDESFLGGPDFQFDLECSSGRAAIGGYPPQGQGSFHTRHCDG